jgi:hypothetical protein
VIDAVAVKTPDGCAARGVESTIWSGPFSEKTWSFTTVPGGMLVAAMLTVTTVALLMATSGTVKLPVGFAGTGYPSIWTTRTDGAEVVGRKSANGDARMRVGLVFPVKFCWKASKRMRPASLAPATLFFPVMVICSL